MTFLVSVPSLKTKHKREMLVLKTANYVVVMTSLGRHNVILMSQDHVESVSRNVFRKCTMFQDQAKMASVTLKISPIRHDDVIPTS